MNIEFADLMRNPEKYGFCSFEDFRKNKDKWRKATERIFEVVQQAGSMHKSQLRRVKYKVAGFNCATLEEAQRVAKDEGLDFSTLDIWPEIIDLTGQRCDIEVEFMTPAQIDLRRQRILMEKQRRENFA